MSRVFSDLDKFNESIFFYLAILSIVLASNNNKFYSFLFTIASVSTNINRKYFLLVISEIVARLRLKTSLYFMNFYDIEQREVETNLSISVKTKFAVFSESVKIYLKNKNADKESFCSFLVELGTSHLVPINLIVMLIN